MFEMASAMRGSSRRDPSRRRLGRGFRREAWSIPVPEGILELRSSDQKGSCGESGPADLTIGASSPYTQRHSLMVPFEARQEG